MKCIYCNSEISSSENICSVCGKNFFSTNDTNNINSVDEIEFLDFDVSSEKSNTYVNSSANFQKNTSSDETLIDAYIGKNQEKIKRENFSFCTLFFSVSYMFYRKMWAFGFLYIIISYLVSLVVPIAVPIVMTLTKNVGLTFLGIILTPLIKLIVNIICLLVASSKFKKSYMKKVIKEVNKIKILNSDKSHETLINICHKKGGTTIIPIVLTLLLPVIMVVLFYSTNASAINKYIGNNKSEENTGESNFDNIYDGFEYNEDEFNNNQNNDNQLVYFEELQLEIPINFVKDTNSNTKYKYESDLDKCSLVLEKYNFESLNDANSFFDRYVEAAKGTDGIVNDLEPIAIKGKLWSNKLLTKNTQITLNVFLGMYLF